jgi:hypothetical protein
MVLPATSSFVAQTWHPRARARNRLASVIGRGESGQDNPGDAVLARAGNDEVGRLGHGLVNRRRVRICRQVRSDRWTRPACVRRNATPRSTGIASRPLTMWSRSSAWAAGWERVAHRCAVRIAGAATDPKCPHSVRSRSEHGEATDGCRETHRAGTVGCATPARSSVLKYLEPPRDMQVEVSHELAHWNYLARSTPRPHAVGVATGMLSISPFNASQSCWNGQSRAGPPTPSHYGLRVRPLSIRVRVTGDRVGDPGDSSRPPKRERGGCRTDQ